jgi:mannose-6-phosphate isomerase-like protein (cupin superfamily)
MHWKPQTFSAESAGCGGFLETQSLCNCQNLIMLTRYKLDDFTKGWFVGNFSPTIVKSDAVEVAVKHYRAGEKESAHYHKVATELTLIVSGRVRMSGEEVGPGEIIKIEPGQATDFVPLTDTTTVVVKLPCVSGDKYVCGDTKA